MIRNRRLASENANIAAIFPELNSAFVQIATRAILLVASSAPAFAQHLWSCRAADKRA